MCVVADWKYANRALRSFENQCALNTYRIHHCKNDIVTYLQVCGYTYLSEQKGERTEEQNVAGEVDGERGRDRAHDERGETQHAGQTHVHARPEHLVQYIAGHSCMHRSTEH